ncbi:prohibitin family protein [Sphingobacteriales bacterium UPWRP_1]|nr:spfh domain, band 7 family protein [Sphingobacteriales bacterium TSM_CSM]PSJ71856.1 prohibitin family protein [Sphingobacteriales bacterium UPWRP_1]
MKITVIALLSVLLFSGCSVIRQGEVGVKRTLGKLKDKEINPGVAVFNPFTSRIIKVPTRTVNLEVKLSLPSKEGLNIKSEISILYNVNSTKASNIIESIGPNYEEVVILSVFRSSAADVCSRFYAKDMHTAERGTIEREIAAHMSKLLNEKGFIIEAVLLKSIQLPPALATAIEDKLAAEQVAQRMEFELQRERLEAERKIIEAQGVRDAQKILSEGLSEQIIKLRSIEAFKELSTSPNTKVIVTDGKTPLLIQDQAK